MDKCQKKPIKEQKRHTDTGIPEVRTTGGSEEMSVLMSYRKPVTLPVAAHFLFNF